jgi:glycosyltransferase involved in cell wall biosynthesis
MAKAAIYLNPEAYNTEVNTLMGRHSAGESFLRGYVRHARTDRFWFWNVTNLAVAKIDAFVNKVEPLTKPATWIQRGGRDQLREPGVAYIPTPNLPKQSWWRLPNGGTAYALCGVTHTTASHDIMDAISDMQLAPVEPWDALICTSRAVRAATDVQLEATRDYMAHRFGVKTPNTPMIETIPLGINTDEFAFNAQSRAKWRAELNIPEDAIVALYVGRFNMQAKMNPVPMALAMESAAKTLGKPLYWVMSGWAHDDDYANRYHGETRKACPSVEYRIVDGRRPETRFSIWSVADFFLSLSDNIQETYGLTPLEAMAAGLPCVVSDWDGYRESVRHNLDGFRISTYAPKAGAGRDLAYRYAHGWDTYSHYIGAASQMTAVDIDEAAQAIVDLATNPDLRKRMGAAAQIQARTHLDWKAIIPRYEALWEEQNRRRLAAIASQPPRNVADNPWRLDPFRIFASYPTEWLTPTTMVSLTPGMTWQEAQTRLTGPLANFTPQVLPTPAETESLYAAVAASPQAIAAELIAAFQPSRRPFMERSLLWFAKYGVVRIHGASQRIAD